MGICAGIHAGREVSDKKYFVLQPLPHPARRLAKEAIDSAQDGMIVTIRPATRSLEANARMWAMLAEVSAHVDWHGRKLSSEDWKHVFSASLKKMDVVPNIENTGFVALGLSTSQMTKKQMSDLMELIAAFGSEHGVVFHD